MLECFVYNNINVCLPIRVHNVSVYESMHLIEFLGSMFSVLIVWIPMKFLKRFHRLHPDILSSNFFAHIVWDYSLLFIWVPGTPACIQILAHNPQTRFVKFGIVGFKSLALVYFQSVICLIIRLWIGHTSCCISNRPFACGFLYLCFETNVWN